MRRQPNYPDGMNPEVLDEQEQLEEHPPTVSEAPPIPVVLPDLGTGSEQEPLHVPFSPLKPNPYIQ